MSDPLPDLEAAFFEEMVESVGVGVAIYGSDGVYRYVNEAYAELLDTDREQLVGMALWEVVPTFEEDQFDDYWASFERGETRTARTEHSFGGTTVPVSTLTTCKSIDGVDYHFGTISDVTELRARERELEEQNERLEAFAGIVAHDLRNPLSVAHSHLELIQQDIDRREMDMLESALTRMEMLIEDLLTLAKQGQTAVDPEPVSLAAVAEEAWEYVSTNDGTLRSPTGERIMADPDRLRQVLENLFRNAVDHAGDAPTVTVGFLGEWDGFFVADDGPGIPENERTRVFEPGYTDSEDGTGFGLAIVSEAAQAHDWSVEVTESENGGARFEFRGVSFPE